MAPRLPLFGKVSLPFRFIKGAGGAAKRLTQGVTKVRLLPPLLPQVSFSVAIPNVFVAQVCRIPNAQPRSTGGLLAGLR